MGSVEREHLLTASQMAHFVTDGFLMLERLVPPALNEAVYADERSLEGAGYQFWHQSEAVHHGIWHCAQPNRTERTRYVFKLRLRPGQVQRGLLNTEGYDSEEVGAIIRRGYQRWQGNEARLDHVQRARLWRYVTGDDSIDVSFEGALTRMAR